MRQIIQLLAVLLLSGHPGKTPTPQPIKLSQSDDARINLSVVGNDSSPKDLTGTAITLTVRSSATATSPLISRLCSIDDTAKGLAHCDLTHGDLGVSTGRYLYDVQVEDSNQLRAQLVPSSDFIITPSIGLPSDTSTSLSPEPPGFLAAIPSRSGQAGKLLSNDGAALLWTSPAVPTTRLLTLTAPLTCNGGGSCDLSADRTLALNITGDIAFSGNVATVGAIHGNPVSNAAPVDGEILQWVAAHGQWEPGTSRQSLKFSLDASDPNLTGGWVGNPFNISLSAFANGTAATFPANARFVSSEIAVTQMFDDCSGNESVNFTLSLNPSLGNTTGAQVISAQHVGSGSGGTLATITHYGFTTTAGNNSLKVGGVTPWAQFLVGGGGNPPSCAGHIDVELTYEIQP